MSNNPLESISFAIDERQKTSEGKRTAMLQFARFIAEYPENQVAEDKIIDVLSNFAGWLCLQRKNDGDYFAPRSLTQYLSGVKETILSQNKYWHIWIGHDGRNGWYGKIRRGLESTAGKCIIDAGERMEDSSPPLSRQQIIAIVANLLLMNTREGILMAIWVSLTRLCIGRAGELAVQSWDCMNWNDAEGGAVLEWHELKTTDKKECLIFERLSTLMEQNRRIKNHIQEIHDLLADIMKHQGIHSPPRKSGKDEKNKPESLIDSSFDLAIASEEGEQNLVAIKPAAYSSIMQEKPTVNQMFLKKFDNTSQYPLITLQGLTVRSAIRDWVKYKLTSTSVRGVGFTLDSKADHISKFKYVVSFALEKAKELDPTSLKVLREPEPTHNDPANRTWGDKINGAAKNIESKLLGFLSDIYEAEMTTKVTGAVEDATGTQKKKKQKMDLTNPTINKVKELIETLTKNK